MAAAAEEEVAAEDEIGIPLPMGPAAALLLETTAGSETVTPAEEVAAAFFLRGTRYAGCCPIGVIDRPEPDPTGAGGVGAVTTSIPADTGGAKEVLLGA